jgi:hypothetical protein
MHRGLFLCANCGNKLITERQKILRVLDAIRKNCRTQCVREEHIESN